jgi:hypothetical protein
VGICEVLGKRYGGVIPRVSIRHRGGATTLLVPGSWWHADMNQGCGLDYPVIEGLKGYIRDDMRGRCNNKVRYVSSSRLVDRSTLWRDSALLSVAGLAWWWVTFRTPLALGVGGTNGR